MVDPSLPFIDLHRHLDGSVRLETILDLGLRHDLALPARDLDGLRPHVQVMEPQPGLAAFLEREHGIGIEANLTSNVQTSTVPDLASHPLRRFLAHGLLATINTDDPAISGIDLPHEYTVAAPRAGLSNGQIQQAQKNALQIAFLSAGERAVLERARASR